MVSRFVLRIVDSRISVTALALGLLVTSLGWWISARPAAADWGNVSEIVTAVATLLLVAGIYVAYWQLRSAAEAVRAQERATKAELLMQFNNEWRSDLLYEGSRYIHNLHDDWDESGGDFGDLAAEWVRKRAGARRRRLSEEWAHRRRLAQYLRHLGYLLAKGYLDPDDVFSTCPEAKRLLDVIIPIENAVIDRYAGGGDGRRSPRRDLARKWELEVLLTKHREWYLANERERFGLHPL